MIVYLHEVINMNFELFVKAQLIWYKLGRNMWWMYLDLEASSVSIFQQNEKAPLLFTLSIIFITFPMNEYLFKVNIENIRTTFMDLF